MSKFIEIDAAEREYGTVYRTLVALDDVLWFNDYVVFFRNGTKLYLGEEAYKALSSVLDITSPRFEIKGEVANIFRGKLVCCPLCKSTRFNTVTDNVDFPEFECLNCGCIYGKWDL